MGLGTNTRGPPEPRPPRALRRRRSLFGTGFSCNQASASAAAPRTPPAPCHANIPATTQVKMHEQFPSRHRPYESSSRCLLSRLFAPFSVPLRKKTSSHLPAAPDPKLLDASEAHYPLDAGRLDGDRTPLHRGCSRPVARRPTATSARPRQRRPRRQLAPHSMSSPRRRDPAIVADFQKPSPDRRSSPLLSEPVRPALRSMHFGNNILEHSTIRWDSPPHPRLARARRPRALHGPQTPDRSTPNRRRNRCCRPQILFNDQDRPRPRRLHRRRIPAISKPRLRHRTTPRLPVKSRFTSQMKTGRRPSRRHLPRSLTSRRYSAPTFSPCVKGRPRIPHTRSDSSPAPTIKSKIENPNRKIPSCQSSVVSTALPISSPGMRGLPYKSPAQYSRSSPRSDAALAQTRATPLHPRPAVENFERHSAPPSGTQATASPAPTEPTHSPRFRAPDSSTGDAIHTSGPLVDRLSEKITKAGAAHDCSSPTRSHDVTIDPADIARKITPRTRGLVPVQPLRPARRQDALDLAKTSHAGSSRTRPSPLERTRPDRRHLRQARRSPLSRNKFRRDGRRGALVTNDDALETFSAMLARRRTPQGHACNRRTSTAGLDGLQAAILNVKTPQPRRVDRGPPKLARHYDARLAAVGSYRVPPSPRAAEHVSPCTPSARCIARLPPHLRPRHPGLSSTTPSRSRLYPHTSASATGPRGYPSPRATIAGRSRLAYHRIPATDAGRLPDGLQSKSSSPPLALIATVRHTPDF